VTKLSQEPRNIPWARDRQERLEKSISALGPERFSIRALECRTARCAVEVAGKGENYSGEIIDDPALRSELIPSISTFGFEKSEAGEDVVVTVMTFLRQSAIDVSEEARIEE
jgi:hypothetical protein